MGIQGFDEDVLAGLARYKPGRRGGQPPVAPGVQAYRQNDGVLRPVGHTASRRPRRGRGYRRGGLAFTGNRVGIEGNRFAKNATTISASLISTVTRGSYVRRSGGAPASHLAHDSQWPMALDLPSAVTTHGRLFQGG